MPCDEVPGIDLTGIDPLHHARLLQLERDMRAHGYQREDPVRSTFALLGDRWTTLILLVLADETWRHAELRRVLGRLGSEERVSQRVMTLKLRQLERDGFVARMVSADVPPKVSYRLTDLGKALQKEALALIEWVKLRVTDIQNARAAYDAGDQH